MTANRLQFATKTDRNGNANSLVIDLTSKEFSRNNHWINCDFIRITRAEMCKIIDSLITADYKEI